MQMGAWRMSPWAVTFVVLSLYATGCGKDSRKARCDDCKPVRRTVLECHHWANASNGDACSTTECIENVLDSATCQEYAGRTGAPDCDNDTARGGEVVQRIFAFDCPGGIVAWQDWQTIVHGCGENCDSYTYRIACETKECGGDKPLRGPFNRGTRHSCGCS